MNETVGDCGAARGVQSTRCRPYRNQAFAEQENDAVVRRVSAIDALKDWRLQTRWRGYRRQCGCSRTLPTSFKLAEKERECASGSSPPRPLSKAGSGSAHSAGGSQPSDHLARHAPLLSTSTCAPPIDEFPGEPSHGTKRRSLAPHSVKCAFLSSKSIRLRFK
jgi:hypothetical protein